MIEDFVVIHFCRGLFRYDLERLLNGFAVCAVNIYKKTCEPSHSFAAEHIHHTSQFTHVHLFECMNHLNTQTSIQ